MKFKNETKEDVLFPVILNDNLPSSKFIIKDGEVKDVPECAIETAKSYGLTPVDEVEADVIDVPNDITQEEADECDKRVEAEESSISDVKVETKKIKSKKAKKVE